MSGACGGGLRTTEHPHASAGATLWATRLSGKLNGEMPSTGPARDANPAAGVAAGRRGDVEGHHLAGDARRLLGGDLERADGARHLGARQRDRLARLAGDELGEGLLPNVDLLGDASEVGLALVARARLQALEGAYGGGYGLFRALVVGELDAADLGTGPGFADDVRGGHDGMT